MINISTVQKYGINEEKVQKFRLYSIFFTLIYFLSRRTVLEVIQSKS